MSDVIREFILNTIDNYPLKKQNGWNVDLVDQTKLENVRWEDTY